MKTSHHGSFPVFIRSRWSVLLPLNTPAAGEPAPNLTNLPGSLSTESRVVKGAKWLKEPKTTGMSCFHRSFKIAFIRTRYIIR